LDVTLAVLADYASGDNKLNIMGVFSELNPPALPHIHPMMFIVVTYEGSPAESGTEKDLRIVLLSGDGKTLLQLDQRISVPQPSRPGSRTSMNAILGLNGVTFEAAGDYHFSVLVNGEEKRAIPLRVNAPKTGETGNG
jgi:hypothetical protein